MLQRLSVSQGRPISRALPIVASFAPYSRGRHDERAEVLREHHRVSVPPQFAFLLIPTVGPEPEVSYAARPFVTAGFKWYAGELLLLPRTRVPVPVQPVAYDQIASLERDDARGVGAGKAVALGVASGVAAFLGTLLIVIAAID